MLPCSPCSPSQAHVPIIHDKQAALYDPWVHQVHLVQQQQVYDKRRAQLRIRTDQRSVQAGELQAPAHTRGGGVGAG